MPVLCQRLPDLVPKKYGKEGVAMSKKNKAVSTKATNNNPSADKQTGKKDK